MSAGSDKCLAQFSRWTNVCGSRQMSSPAENDQMCPTLGRLNRWLAQKKNGAVGHVRHVEEINGDGQSGERLVEFVEVRAKLKLSRQTTIAAIVKRMKLPSKKGIVRVPHSSTLR